jgi:hypothetical protein
VTKQGSPDFAPAAERIAVFDNDGTLAETRNQHTGPHPSHWRVRPFRAAGEIREQANPGKECLRVE